MVQGWSKLAKLASFRVKLAASSIRIAILIVAPIAIGG
jgi:hypothetical protein